MLRTGRGRQRWRRPINTTHVQNENRLAPFSEGLKKDQTYVDISAGVVLTTKPAQGGADHDPATSGQR